MLIWITLNKTSFKKYIIKHKNGLVTENKPYVIGAKHIGIVKFYLPVQKIVFVNNRIFHHLPSSLLDKVENAHHHSPQSDSFIFNTLNFLLIMLCYCFRPSYQHSILIRPYLRTSFNQYIPSHCTNYFMLVSLIFVKKHHRSRHYSNDLYFTQFISLCLILTYSNLKDPLSDLSDI